MAYAWTSLVTGEWLPWTAAASPLHATCSVARARYATVEAYVELPSAPEVRVTVTLTPGGASGDEVGFLEHLDQGRPRDRDRGRARGGVRCFQVEIPGRDQEPRRASRAESEAPVEPR